MHLVLITAVSIIVQGGAGGFYDSERSRANKEAKPVFMAQDRVEVILAAELSLRK